jgi:hypothetical protein
MENRHDMEPSPGRNAKTASLRRGRHASPEDGACVMELASMLAGEGFSDHPRSVCPVIASFLRVYNDEVSDRDRHELLAYAPSTIGTRGDRRLQRRRHRRLLHWAHPGWSTPRAVAVAWLWPASLTAQECARRAASIHISRRRPEVDRLLRSLIGAPEQVAGEIDASGSPTDVEAGAVE